MSLFSTFLEKSAGPRPTLSRGQAFRGDDNYTGTHNLVTGHWSPVTLLILLLVAGCRLPDRAGTKAGPYAESRPEYAIAIHGGAGVILKENLSDELEKAYLHILDSALTVGETVLKSGGTSLDAIEKVIRIMEDCPLFNAGKGAVYTHEGYNELDAAIMDGSNLMAGTVAGVRNVKNPISLARKVMTNSQHVMLSGAGATEFAREQGLEIVDSTYFFTERRWSDLQKAIEKQKENKFGTVGCVCLDTYGNIAAGTSTGGMTNKRWNRIGDTPVIGAGTYASNKSCAVSGTGHGEFFIRYTVAREIAALMEYQNMSVQQAAEEVVMNRLKNAGGEGGIIALDHNGNIALVFNSPGMYRGAADSKGRHEVAIYSK
ncbi:MAG TPA: beta-aspartyl-peptidase [Bacteroidales bacterium]|nr:beta-aspartyl-peptidase [Bacteroidales bacterium]